MQIDILQRPASTVAQVRLQTSERISAEAGAMVAMTPSINIETSTMAKNRGGIISGLKRMVGGESFFVNHFTAQADDSEIFLAPTLQGDMFVLDLKPGESIIAQGGSWVASETGVGIDTTWQGFKNFLSGESLFWLRLSGPGQVLLSSFGCVYTVDVDGEYIVDTGHIVAFEPTLEFKLTKAGKSWISSILGGEGLVCRFQGRGRLWCQSHSAQSFGQELGPKLKAR